MDRDIPNPAQDKCARCDSQLYHHESPDGADTWACSDPECRFVWDASLLIALLIDEPPSISAFRECVRAKTEMWERALAPVFEQLAVDDGTDHV